MLNVSDFRNIEKRKFWKVIRHFVKNDNSSSSNPRTLWRLQRALIRFTTASKSFKNGVNKVRSEFHHSISNY